MPNAMAASQATWLRPANDQAQGGRLAQSSSAHMLMLIGMRPMKSQTMTTGVPGSLQNDEGSEGGQQGHHVGGS